MGHGDFTCPRCGLQCSHLVMPYYDSPWRPKGGLCGNCCQDAAEWFDRLGWPDPAPDAWTYEPPPEGDDPQP
jgi:hypothetical protein